MFKGRAVALVATMASAIVLSVPGLSVGATAMASSTVPQPAAYNRLSDVTCVAAADCWAVGSAQDMNNNVTGEILHWSGTSWTLVPSPAASGTLRSISCASAKSCVAIGYSGNNGARALAIRWNGTAWTNTPLPNASNETVNDVTCTSSSNCWIAGASGRTRNAMLALHWSGSRWVQTKTLPADKYGETLDSITCTGGSRCWALGSYYGAPLKPTVSNYLIALRWNGAAWRKVWVSKPFLGGDSSQTVSVGEFSCLTASNCLGVGGWGLPGVYSSALEVRWNGRSWSNATLPHSQRTWLYGLACTSSKNCWAVGDIGGLGSERGLTLHSIGTGWARAKAPATETLSAVSCASSSECFAVGDAKSSAGSDNVIQQWTGTSWLTL